MLNTITIIGRLGKDIELRSTASGDSVCSFSLAVDRDFKNKDGNKDTDWLDCVVWRNDADYLYKYAHKGDLLCISGRLQTRAWMDKDDRKHIATEIVSKSVYIINSKAKGVPAVEYGIARKPELKEIEEAGELPF